MKKTYFAWIAQHVPGNPIGMCSGVTLKMQKAFPELKRVRGWYRCRFWGERDHWWLVSPEGEIIDPTADQFPSLGGGEYRPIDESNPDQLVRVGKCMDCGGPVYDTLANADAGNSRPTFCSDKCRRASEAYLNGTNRGFQ